jgi:splicing factor 3B subunit 3
MGQYRVTPLSYDALSHASAFSSERCPEGIVAIAENTIRIFSVEHIGE